MRMKDKIEFNEKARQVGEDFVGWFNCFDEESRQEAMSKVIMGEHRTLQQSVMRFFLYQMEQWAKTSNYDDRNEATIRKCQKIMEFLKDDKYLPMI